MPGRSEEPDAPVIPSAATLVVKGVSWNTAGLVTQTVLSAGALFVIARHLSPADFAIGGIALTVTSILAVLAGASFIPAIVQRPQLERAACDSIFWFAFALSGTLVLAVWAMTTRKATEKEAITIGIATRGSP